MSERVLIADGVTGPAYIIVPLSENELDKWIFNDITELIFARECKSESEILQVMSVVYDLYDLMADEDPAPSTRDEAKAYHGELYLRWKAKRES
jgi:hypothetical protein